MKRDEAMRFLIGILQLYCDADKDLSEELVKDSRFVLSQDEEIGATLVTLPGNDMIETGTELFKEVVGNLYVP